MFIVRHYHVFELPLIILLHIHILPALLINSIHSHTYLLKSFEGCFVFVFIDLEDLHLHIILPVNVHLGPVVMRPGIYDVGQRHLSLALIVLLRICLKEATT